MCSMTDSQEDPYPGYAQLRTEAPDSPAHGYRQVADHPLRRCPAALHDPRLSKSPDSAPAWMRDLGLITEDRTRLGAHMLSADPSVHTGRLKTTLA
jgi:hypothetical protein